MRRILRLRTSPATVIAALALFVALGGGATAAGVLITGKQIKNGSVSGADVGNGSIASADVKNGSLSGLDVRDQSLTPADFSGSVQGPPGPTGPQGPKGDTGATGPEGPPNPNALFAQNADKLDGIDSTQLLRLDPPERQVLPTHAHGTPSLWLESGVDLGNNTRYPSQFKVQNDGGFLVTGELGIGTIPATGEGYRMMWHPYKAAFRAGDAQGTEWDDANIGFYSWAGGSMTRASGLASFAFGGESRSDAAYSTAMGYRSRATGTASAASGANVAAVGSFTTALGQHAATAPCLAAGTCTQDNLTNSDGRPGSFVFGDNSTTNWLTASANNQFNVRAAGGVRLFTNSTLTTGCQLPAGSGTWSCTSDRNAKRDFAAADPKSVLARLAHLPISTWAYKTEKPSVRHMGPMAQDFRRAFGLGSDKRRIDLIDAQGVNMAAVQGLYQLAKTQEQRLDAQQAQIAKLERRLAAVER